MKTINFSSTEPSAARNFACHDSPLPKESFEALKRTERELKRARDYAEAIVESVPPLLILDAQLRVKTANESFYKHFRVTPPQTENCLVYELGNGQWDIPKLRTFLQDILPRNSFFKDFEVTHTFESIGRRTVMLSGRQLDHPERILLFIDDITERLESRAVMRASEIRYRRLFEAARDGILILDSGTGKITEANPFMTELLGYPHDELLGKELWQIGLLKDEAASQEAFRELQSKHFIRYENLPLQGKAGQGHEVEFVSNLYEEDGRKVIQCNIRDITRRKQTERALRKAEERLTRHAAELETLVSERTAQLQATVSDLQAFSYSVSHDMRAPLRAMQGFAERLLQEYGGKLDEQATDHLQRIMRSSIRLDRLIQDVLRYTKVLHAQVPLGPVDLDRLVRDIIETYPNGNKSQIQIQGTLPNVLGNEALLTQCISNLLSNAIKFVPPGIKSRVEIWAETRESTKVEATHASKLPDSSAAMVRIWFGDNGIGIAKKDQDRVFQMFERIHPAAEFDGTGIGLTIVRKAVERMGAQLGLESEQGKGSRFWIQLAKG